MQEASEVVLFRTLISIERLVESVQGTKTACLYAELKRMAISRDNDWRALVHSISMDALAARIRWCEVFVGDLMLLQQRAAAFEDRMVRQGIDLTCYLGSKQHEEKKLLMLLTRGEDYTAQADICEDVLLRAVRRLITLVDWAYAVSFDM